MAVTGKQARGSVKAESTKPAAATATSAAAAAASDDEAANEHVELDMRSVLSLPKSSGKQKSNGMHMHATRMQTWPSGDLGN